MVWRAVDHKIRGGLIGEKLLGFVGVVAFQHREGGQGNDRVFSILGFHVFHDGGNSFVGLGQLLLGEAGDRDHAPVFGHFLRAGGNPSDRKAEEQGEDDESGAFHGAGIFI